MSIGRIFELLYLPCGAAACLALHPNREQIQVSIENITAQLNFPWLGWYVAQKQHAARSTCPCTSTA